MAFGIIFRGPHVHDVHRLTLLHPPLQLNRAGREGHLVLKVLFGLRCAGNLHLGHDGSPLCSGQMSITTVSLRRVIFKATARPIFLMSDESKSTVEGLKRLTSSFSFKTSSLAAQAAASAESPL